VSPSKVFLKKVKNPVPCDSWYVIPAEETEITRQRQGTQHEKAQQTKNVSRRKSNTVLVQAVHARSADWREELSPKGADAPSCREQTHHHPEETENANAPTRNEYESTV
jgi:hypothetical protein